MNASAIHKTVSASLPDFPWDSLVPFVERARLHPAGVVDLSMGTPIDPVPAVVQNALVAAADAPSYPTVAGTSQVRSAICAWLMRRCGVQGVSPTVAAGNVLPTIGAKELVASLPSQLGLGSTDTVVIPELAYPTYEVGARLAGAQVYRSTSLSGDDWPASTRLVWVNSPANPSGKVLSATQLRQLVMRARDQGAILVSDECYIELGWETTPVSVLHPQVCDGSFESLLAVHSLSKRSNLAGYRAGFISGDSRLIAELLTVRKHAGAMVATPVQAAMAVALADDEHVDLQRQRYADRRVALRAALIAAGFRIEHSDAGLYLWATRDQDCWETVGWFAERGIVVSPGSFYGPAGQKHVRVALTASDERVAAVVARLAQD